MISNMTSSGEKNWIYIVSSAYASLPSPGNRVGPSDAANMPTIIGTTAAGGAVQTANNAHHYRFVGIEIKPKAGDFITNLVSIGAGDTSLTTLPHDICFDRCYLHGDPTVGGRRGVAMNGASVAVIDSYLSDFKEVGADTQALWSYNSPGPLKIVNNYLSAAGENVMFGGNDPSITNLVPSDIEIRRNHFFKPLAWITENSPNLWSVKNILEFKNAQRAVVEGNIFENNWIAAQNGMSILLTPRNQNNTAPWSVVQDITIRLNKLINVGQGFNLSGRDDTFSSQVTTRVLVENTVVEVTRLNGADGRIFGIFGGPQYLTIRHNTGLITVAGGTTAFSENNPVSDQFDFRDNMLSNGSYGFLGTNTGTCNSTLSTYYTNYTLTKNAIISGGPSSDYPANNFFPADNAAVGFVDYAAGNYALTAGSTYHNAASDGTDIGADFTALNAAILNSGAGQWGNEPATYTGGASSSPAERPRVYIDTTYRPQSGAVLNVNSAATFQAALNSVQRGGTIVMDVAGTYSGNFTLP